MKNHITEDWENIKKKKKTYRNTKYCYSNMDRAGKKKERETIRERDREIGIMIILGNKSKFQNIKDVCVCLQE